MGKLMKEQNFTNIETDEECVCAGVCVQTHHFLNSPCSL